MSGSEMNFDATGIKPSTGTPDPIPVGEYRMAITDSETKRTEDGRGVYLKLTLEVLDGPYKGRRVWENLNVQNENEMTQKIAQEQLSAVCHSTGVLKLKNSAQLHNIPMLCKVGIKNDKGYGPKNRVTRFKSVEGGIPSAPVTAAAPASVPENAPSWATRKVG